MHAHNTIADCAEAFSSSCVHMPILASLNRASVLVYMRLCMRPGPRRHLRPFPQSYLSFHLQNSFSMHVWNVLNCTTIPKLLLCLTQTPSLQRYPSGNVLKWYSDAAMAQLGTVEVAALFPDIARNATPWITSLIDTVFMAPGGPVSVLLGGANWSAVCDRNGVPPAVIIAANRTSHAGDLAAVRVIAEQAMQYPHEGRCEGLMQLPTGVIARSSGGSWHYPPPPPLNRTQVRQLSALTSTSSRLW